MHLLDAANHKSDALVQGDPETRHARVGKCNFAALTLLHENGDYAAAASHHVAVSNAAKPRVLCPGIRVRLHKHFFRAQLRRTIKIDWINRFVGTLGRDPPYAAVDGSVD